MVCQWKAHLPAPNPSLWNNRFLNIPLFTKDWTGALPVCADSVRKAKAELKLKLSRDVKKQHKRVLHVHQEWAETEGKHWPAVKHQRWITQQQWKGTFVTFVFTSTAGPQALGTKIQFDANTDPPSMKEDFLHELYRSSTPTNRHALTISAQGC